jgi:ribonuclease D
VTDHKILAFDGEWVSFMYSYGEPGLSILQLATIGVTYIFDVHKLKDQAKFYNLIKGLFAAENILKVGHTIKSDIDMINHSFKG